MNCGFEESFLYINHIPFDSYIKGAVIVLQATPSNQSEGRRGSGDTGSTFLAC